MPARQLHQESSCFTAEKPDVILDGGGKTQPLAGSGNSCWIVAFGPIVTMWDMRRVPPVAWVLLT
jgi:hypothetical protein